MPDRLTPLLKAAHPAEDPPAELRYRLDSIARYTVKRRRGRAFWGLFGLAVVGFATWRFENPVLAQVRFHQMIRTPVNEVSHEVWTKDGGTSQIWRFGAFDRYFKRTTPIQTNLNTPEATYIWYAGYPAILRTPVRDRRPANVWSPSVFSELADCLNPISHIERMSLDGRDVDRIEIPGGIPQLNERVILFVDPQTQVLAKEQVEDEIGSEWRITASYIRTSPPQSVDEVFDPKSLGPYPVVDGQAATDHILTTMFHANEGTVDLDPGHSLVVRAAQLGENGVLYLATSLPTANAKPALPIHVLVGGVPYAAGVTDGLGANPIDPDSGTVLHFRWFVPADGATQATHGPVVLTWQVDAKGALVEGAPGAGTPVRLATVNVPLVRVAKAPTFQPIWPNLRPIQAPDILSARSSDARSKRDWNAVIADERNWFAYLNQHSTSTESRWVHFNRMVLAYRSMGDLGSASGLRAERDACKDRPRANDVFARGDTSATNDITPY